MNEIIPWVSLAVSAVSALMGMVLKLQEAEKERRFFALESFSKESSADRMSLRAQNAALQTDVATLRQQLSSNTSDTSALRYQITRLEDKIDIISKQLAGITAKHSYHEKDLRVF